jgi:1-acyl-sn-glycerol-3-phosphate acyltransferase
MRASGHIRVDRRTARVADALAVASAAIGQGSVVLVYPEGRIGLDPHMWPERGKTGTARLALETGAVVVPVAHWGAHEVLPYSSPRGVFGGVARALWRRPVVRVHFGPPVDLSGLRLGTPGHAQRATDRIIDGIAEALATIRVDEPELPRFIDRSRPTDLSRVRRRRAGPPASAGAALPQVGEHRFAGGAHAQEFPGLGDAPVGGPQR